MFLSKTAIIYASSEYEMILRKTWCYYQWQRYKEEKHTKQNGENNIIPGSAHSSSYHHISGYKSTFGFMIKSMNCWTEWCSGRNSLFYCISFSMKGKATFPLRINVCLQSTDRTNWSLLWISLININIKYWVLWEKKNIPVIH